MFKMDRYEELKFSQLAVAHRCSILFFTKDKFSNLGKKLRPEFDKLYLSSELKDCIKLLSTPVIEGGELHNPVDLVLLDYDPGAVRLVDFINKRTTDPQTKGCPIIPTVVIMSENNEREATEHIRTAGGVTKVVRQPFMTKDLLYTLLDVITTQKKVEETFRSLTKKKIISSKYPYMPIFDNPIADAAAVAVQEAEQKELERTARKSLVRHGDHESVRSGTVSGSFISQQHEQKVEELEDGTECSSLLPDFVKRIRRESPELNSPYRQERLRDAADAGNLEEERLQAEAAERLAWRTRLASRDTRDDGSLESGSVGAVEPEREKEKPDEAEVTAPAKGAIVMLVDTRRQGSTDPHADALNYSSASLDKSSIASLVRKHQRAEEQGGLSMAASSTAGTNTAPQNKIQELLSSGMRPVWLDAKPGGSGKDARLEALARSRRENGKLAYGHVVDIRPFVNKPPPLVQRPSTVGGLDRRAAEAYWRAFKPTKGLGTRKEKSEGRFLASTEPAIELPTIDEHHHHGGPRSASAGFSSGTAKLFPPPSPSHKASNHGSAHGSTHTSASDLSNHLASFGMHDAVGTGSGHHNHHHVHTTATADGVASHSSEAFPISPSERGFRRFSHASLSTASQSKDYTNATSTAPQMSPTRAEKKIVEMATEVAPDLQVSVLLEIDFSNRKINLGEKEMLMKGLRLEREGDLDAAISCYSRAGMHSKDPHISKILVGNLHYKNEALMLALNFYTQAAQLLSSRTASTRLVTDEFITYRNRGIINFRLGDDQLGISDLTRAVDLMPQDIELRELLSLAKRRVGKYAQAIQEAAVAKTIRNERRRQEMILEKQRDLIRKKQFLISERERHRQRVTSAGAGGATGGGVVVYNASAKFTQFASRSSRHASVMSRSAAAAAAAQMDQQSVASDGELMGMSGKQTLFADSSTLKEDDINARLLQTRGYVLQIDEPRCLNSLRDRVAEGRKNLKKELENDQQSSEETFLRVFKMNNGYKADLFQDIFERPSELQEALLVPPERRTQEDLDVITTSLRLIPLLAKASSSVLADLAKAVEYRALTTKDVIFSQGDQSCAACFLLSGHVQLKMEKQSAGTSMVDIPIGEVPEYTTFGHIDFLFRNNNHRIMHEVEKVIRPRRPLRRAAATEGGDAQTSAATSGGVGGHLHSPSTHYHKHHHHHHHPGRSPGAATTIEEGDEEEDGDGSTVDHEIATPMLTYVGAGGGRGGTHVDRSLAPGMFKTYAIQSMCELLILRENDFEKLLLQPALDDLNRRLDAIRSCGIFADWTPAQHVRLARMGIVKRVHKGDTILTQGYKPNFLCIILKGICVVQKQPNRTEMLVQKLTAAREKAAIFDSRYIFDHKLVDTLRMANVREEFKAANADNPDVAFTLADAKRNPDSILRQRNVTESELERYKLQLEINKLEALIQSAAMEDARDEDLVGNNFAAFAGLAGSRRFVNSSNPSLNGGGGTGNNSCTNTNNNTNTNTNGAPVLELKVADIAHIQWPKIFGEACILDPENGRSRGSVVADTACEIFMLHKAQIQTFPVDDAFLSSVKVKAVAYPGDPDVVLSLYRKQEWKKFRAEVLDEIPKTRWLRGDEGVVKEPFRMH